MGLVDLIPNIRDHQLQIEVKFCDANTWQCGVLLAQVVLLFAVPMTVMTTYLYTDFAKQTVS